MDDLIIVDCQYDFIDGTLACAHSHEAVAWLVRGLSALQAPFYDPLQRPSPDRGPEASHSGLTAAETVPSPSRSTRKRYRPHRHERKRRELKALGVKLVKA